MIAYTKFNGVVIPVNIRDYNGAGFFNVDDMKGQVLTVKKDEIHTKNGKKLLFDKGRIVKKCKTCGIVKEWNFTNFHKDMKSIDGTSHHCKICVSIKSKKKRLEKNEKKIISYVAPRDKYDINFVLKALEKRKEKLKDELKEIEKQCEVMEKIIKNI